MSDPHPSKAVRVQSSAIVLAAAITTSGAVTSAFIQTGWIEKPPRPAVAMLQPYAMGPAAAAADVKPLRLEQESLGSDRAGSQPAPSKTRASATPAARVTFHAPLAAPHEASPQADGQVWNVSKPALLPAGTASSPRLSPWYYLSHPTASDKLSDATISAKKSFDWGAVARFFRWPK